MQEIRQKYYFPSIATYARNWVSDCEICIHDKRINNTRITPELIHIPEWDHAKIKISLKMASGEYKKLWHKYLPIAILNYNTTYHFSIDCEPSQVFHGRVPHNILDHKLGLRFNPSTAPTTDFAEESLRSTKVLYDKTKKKVMQSYIKFKK